MIILRKYWLFLKHKKNVRLVKLNSLGRMEIFRKDRREESVVVWRGGEWLKATQIIPPHTTGGSLTGTCRLGFALGDIPVSRSQPLHRLYPLACLLAVPWPEWERLRGGGWFVYRFGHRAVGGRWGGRAPQSPPEHHDRRTCDWESPRLSLPLVQGATLRRYNKKGKKGS